MTNPPGDEGQSPPDRNDPPSDPSNEQPGYWQQQSQQPPSGEQQPPQYGQPPHGQPQYGQPQYGQPQYGQPQGYPVAYAPDHPKATTALVLGILGVVLCQFIAPFAWRIGKRTVNEIDAAQGRLGGRGSAQAGYVLGIVGTVLLGLVILYIIVVAGVLVAAVTNSGSTV